MSINEQLMQRTATSSENEQPNSQVDDSAELSGSLRQTRRGGGGEDEYAPDNYFAAMYGARLKNRKEQAEKEKKGGLWQSLKKSMSSGPSKLLVSAWRNIVTSWGTSFFYVYAHLFLKNVFGDDKFAPLGSEWADRPGITKEMRDKIGSKVKLYETIGVTAISVVLFIAIIFAFAIPAFIIDVASDPLDISS